jgi:hypothetical protein
MQQSPCFLQSKDRLSCLTCHTPHQDADARPGYYEKVCLNCHGTPAQRDRKLSAGLASKPCPVNAQSGCLNCHMPIKKFMPSITAPIFRRDHRIAIHRELARDSH